VVVKSDGCIYFTDPWTSPRAPEQWDLNIVGVYRITPDLGTMSLLVSDFVLPNGLAFSPDETVLYINDTRRKHIRAFDLLPNGTLAKQTDRIFADLQGDEPGVRRRRLDDALFHEPQPPGCPQRQDSGRSRAARIIADRRSGESGGAVIGT